MSDFSTFEEFIGKAKGPRLDIQTNESHHIISKEEYEAKLGLIGEVGELMEMYKKQSRDGKYYCTDEFKDELGDILHYLVRIILDHGFTVKEIIEVNIEKIKIRNKL